VSCGYLVGSRARSSWLPPIHPLSRSQKQEEEKEEGEGEEEGELIKKEIMLYHLCMSLFQLLLIIPVLMLMRIPFRSVVFSSSSSSSSSFFTFDTQFDSCLGRMLRLLLPTVVGMPARGSKSTAAYKLTRIVLSEERACLILIVSIVSYLLSLTLVMGGHLICAACNETTAQVDTTNKRSN